MKVGANREQLENEIYKVLYDINQNREVKDEILNNLVQRGFSIGTAQQLLSQNMALETLNQYELGVIAYVIFKTTYAIMVDPSMYYDAKELETIEQYHIRTENKKTTFPIIFKNMIKYAENKWVGTISVQDFVQINQNGLVTYNFETQRNPIYKKYKGVTIKKANINPSAVKEITERMINNTYEYDDVTINILADGREDFQFNVIQDSLGDLIINDATLNLIDGAHRLKGAEGALLRSPDIQGNFILVVTNFDVDEANHYIIQKDKRNPIDREYIEAKDITNLNNDVVRKINESMKSDIRGKITTDEYLINEGDALTLFSIMSKTIGRLWKVETRADSRKLSNYLIDFFNELVGIFPDELKKNIKNTRNKNYINHPNMFIYYLTIAKEIQGEEDWEDLLEIIIEETDFSKRNNEWKGTVTYIGAHNIDSKLPSIIRTYRDKISKIKEGVI